MDESNNEQTELLRNLWRQMVATDRGLSSRIDKTNANLEHTHAHLETMDRNLTGRLDQTNARLDKLDRNLSGQIDQTNARLDKLDRNLSGRIEQTNARLDETNARLDRLVGRVESLDHVATENFPRIQRNFERIDQRLETLAERGRLEDLDARLTRVESHIGLRPEE